MEAAGLVRLGQSRLVFHVPHSMSGFIQPALLLDLLQKEDVDGFSDRQLFDRPADIDPMYDQNRQYTWCTVKTQPHWKTGRLPLRDNCQSGC